MWNNRGMRDYLPILAEALTGMFLAGLLVAACAAALGGCATVPEKTSVGEADGLVCYGAVDAEGVPVMVCVPHKAKGAGSGQAM